jgi:hypothetical protein
VLLKTFWQPVRRYDGNASYSYDLWIKYGMNIIDWIMDIEDIDVITKREVKLQSLRLILFSEMDLTHTCCRYDSWNIKPAMDEDEALEVIDEEAEIIHKFEALARTAKGQLIGTSKRFSSFVKGFIREYIVYNHTNQKVDKEYAQKVRDLGVQVADDLEKTETDISEMEWSSAESEAGDSEVEMKGIEDNSRTMGENESNTEMETEFGHPYSKD